MSDILIADIGGTNTRVKVFRNKIEIKSEVVKTSMLRNKFYQYIDSLLEFETEVYLAVAGRVVDDSVTLTNLDLKINKLNLISNNKILNVTLINDFLAQAYIYFLNDLKGDFYDKKLKNSSGNVLFIGAGTGLGLSMLSYDVENNQLELVPLELSHNLISNFLDDLTIVKEIKKIQNKKFLEFEDVVSGRGFEAIYKFISNQRNFSWTNLNEDIFNQTIKIFSELYCRVTYHFIKELNIRGGVYILGGILHKNYDILKDLMIEEFNLEHSKLRNNSVFFSKENEVITAMIKEIHEHGLLRNKIKLE